MLRIPPSRSGFRFGLRSSLRATVFLSLLSLAIVPSLPDASSIPAAWIPIPAPPGGSIGRMMAVGPYAWVAANRGLVYSSDQGRTWRTLDTADPAMGMLAVWRSGDARGDSLIGATKEGSLVSADGGRTWKPGPPRPGTPQARDLWFSDNAGAPGERWIDHDGIEQFIGKPDARAAWGGVSFRLFEGILRQSRDGAVTWTEVKVPGAHEKGYVAMIVDAGTLYLADESGETVSRDNGRSWSRTRTQPRERGQGITGMVRGEGFWLARTFSGWLYRSEDQGRHWTPVDLGLKAWSLDSFAAVDSCLFAGSRHGLFRSRDNGASWKAMLIGDTVLLPGKMIAFGTDVVLGNDRGIWISGNRGDTWKTLPLGWDHWGNVAFAVDQGALYAGTNFGLFRSRGRGDSLILNDTAFSGFENGSGTRDLWGVAVRGKDILVSSERHSLSHSADGGRNWDEVEDWYDALHAYKLWGMGSRVFVAAPDGLYRGTWKAKGWKKVLVGGPVTTRYPEYPVTALARNGARLVAGTCQGRFYTSVNDGKDWTPLLPSLPLLKRGGEAVEDSCTGFDLSVNAKVEELSFMDGSLYVWQGETGMWRRDWVEKTSSK